MVSQTKPRQEEKTISGGQRKRLNIALELIREPAVLFLDEQTESVTADGYMGGELVLYGVLKFGSLFVL